MRVGVSPSRDIQTVGSLATRLGCGIGPRLSGIKAATTLVLSCVQLNEPIREALSGELVTFLDRPSGTFAT